MKTKEIISYLGILFGFFIFSCSSTKEIVEIQKPIETKIEKPIIWKQSYFKEISLKDSVLFYNSSEILLEGSFFNQSFFVENGVVNVIDSINSVSKIVPKLTPGGFIDMKKNSSGEITIMVVSFSKKETIYKFSFFKTQDGSFILSGKAEIIFNGHKYPVTASITDQCFLLFYFRKQEIKNETIGVAEGWKEGY